MPRESKQHPMRGTLAEARVNSRGIPMAAACFGALILLVAAAAVPTMTKFG